MLHHEAMHHHATRIAVLELRGDRLELDLGRADGERQVIEAIRIGGEEQALDPGRPPVAVQPAEEQLTELPPRVHVRSEEHTSELQSPCNLVCRLLLEKKKNRNISQTTTTACKSNHKPPQEHQHHSEGVTNALL